MCSDIVNLVYTYHDESGGGRAGGHRGTEGAEGEADPESKTEESNERDMRGPWGWYPWWPGSQGEGGAICPPQVFRDRIDDSANLRQERPAKMQM